MNKDILLYIIQIISIYNAIKLGWNIKKIGKNKYELTRPRESMEDFCLETFIRSITNINLENSAVV